MPSPGGCEINRESIDEYIKRAIPKRNCALLDEVIGTGQCYAGSPASQSCG
jgi:hypothetical protein